MPGTKEIKRRIISVKNTKKITKAMELVAASKMKRAVASTLASRLYAEYSWNILTSIAQNLEESTHSFFNKQKEGKILVVLITSNRGLCGGYNSQIIKKTIQKLRELGEENQADFITVGKKGDVAMRKINQNITGVFSNIPDVNLKLSDIFPLSKLITDEYRSLAYKKVFIAYTDFISALTQKPIVKQLLPISKEEIKEIIENLSDKINHHKTDYLFEGDFNTLIDSLAEKITKMQIYQMLLESNASEQSSRMVAMKNASEASGEMIDDLTLVFNKTRQANITREISEISAGMASVS
ncbi:ATP synthase F1 subunit gamma [Candidatus Nomurabacteria bacterium RIFCSPHIGHO2_01_FULL_38_19]|uniref:ATP synthase gamma chain n=1 Tax=Candidatus Nomurabacteria bacterium RIFCSPHIGHO2_01_FULL_38_19 TaxID=1801732 RepID=A0A1F6UV70_9BACT|nr:MAG: ATP synthase F1 subunit gamma [Candidatus Nomurabacteria bacterium RIFCSPHIGHO2_01_FULL_38_19]